MCSFSVKYMNLLMNKLENVDRNVEFIPIGFSWASVVLATRASRARTQFTKWHQLQINFIFKFSSFLAKIYFIAQRATWLVNKKPFHYWNIRFVYLPMMTCLSPWFRWRRLSGSQWICNALVYSHTNNYLKW